MSFRRVLTGGVAIALAVAGGLTAVGAAPTAAGAAGPSCPLKALSKASKPVQITFWQSLPQANLAAINKLVAQFNASQTDVKVNVVSQVSYDDTFTKYKAGLSSGDLPDIVMLQETDQQQMIDTTTVLPSGACAKADKYSFSDFLPRVVSYYTVKGQMYAMPFNVSGPVLYYNKKSFTAAGLDPEKPPASLDELVADAQKIKAAGAVSKAPLGLKTEPGFIEHMIAIGGSTFVNNDNGRKARATKSTFDNKTGRQVFQTLSTMVKNGLAEPTPDSGTGTFNDLIGIGNGQFAMAFDTSASLGTISQFLATGAYPNVSLGVAPMVGASPKKGGVLVSGGALYMVNKSEPAKQAAAWKFLKWLDEPAQQTTWSIDTGYIPIRKAAAATAAMQDYWAKNPAYKVAYDQLLSGPNTVATAGSVIGNYKGVRDAVRDAENSMFLQGKDPRAALKDAASNANSAISDYNSRVG
ncbi:MAG TPA: ABC transporter substrate-binding protein [Acidimicrobiia bacterium]|nr:ABC transporter substrate-binding protein [Acidimicrobiia bacterium]